MLTTLLLTLFTAHAAPLTPDPIAWIDLADSRALVLTQDLTLAPALVLKAGTRLEYASSLPLDTVDVTEFDVSAAGCEFPDQETTDMVLVNPDPDHPLPDGHDPSVGVLLKRACWLEIYVENRDLQSASLFRRAAP